MRMGICFATVSIAVHPKLESIMNTLKMNDDGREVEEVGGQVPRASSYNFPSIIKILI